MRSSYHLCIYTAPLYNDQSPEDETSNLTIFFIHDFEKGIKERVRKHKAFIASSHGELQPAGERLSVRSKISEFAPRKELHLQFQPKHFLLFIRIKNAYFFLFLSVQCI